MTYTYKYKAVARPAVHQLLVRYNNIGTHYVKVHIYSNISRNLPNKCLPCCEKSSFLNSRNISSLRFEFCWYVIHAILPGINIVTTLKYSNSHKTKSGG